MKTEQFHREYEIDRTAGVPKATPKHVPEIERPAAIADGTSYRNGQIYFFFDQNALTVRTSEGLRRLDADRLGTQFGLGIIRISELYEKRSDAIDAAQKFLLTEIERLRDRICELEESKPKNERSLKRILQARGI